MVKSAVISSFLSRTKDRFHEYNEVKDLEQRLQMICDMEGRTTSPDQHGFQVLHVGLVLALGRRAVAPGPPP